MTLQTFNELPKEVQDDAKETLKAYDECYISYEYGKYHVSVGVCIKSKYATDYKHFGSIKATQIYSEEEMKDNHKEVFGYEF